jgi:hypothetical protein
MKVLKTWKTCSPEERWERIQNAREWLQVESASMRKASQSFDVPLTTLSRAINQKWASLPQHGADSVLSVQQELGLVEVIVWRSQRGMCITPDELRFLAHQVALAQGNCVTESFPTRGWLEGFMMRHKAKVSMRSAQILSIARFHASDEGLIRIYHENLKAAVMQSSTWVQIFHQYILNGKTPPPIGGRDQKSYRNHCRNNRGDAHSLTRELYTNSAPGAFARIQSFWKFTFEYTPGLFARPQLSPQLTDPCPPEENLHGTVLVAN